MKRVNEHSIMNISCVCVCGSNQVSTMEEMHQITKKGPIGMMMNKFHFEFHVRNELARLQ